MMSSLLHWLPYFALAAVLAQWAVFVIRPGFLFRRRPRAMRFRLSGDGVDRVLADLQATTDQSQAAQASLARLFQPRPPL